MLNQENTSPGTCKNLQPSSLSEKGQRNQIDGSFSLNSLVCIMFILFLKSLLE